MKKDSPFSLPWIDYFGIIFSFGIVIFLMIGDYLNGRYNVLSFIPLFIFPIMYRLRFRDITPDLALNYHKQSKSFFSFDILYLWIVIVISIAAIPYQLALLGILVQDTWLNLVFTGYWEHAGLHHGWVGWFFIIEAYFYHRINRLTQNYHDSSILLRNGLVIVGFFLFIDDYWFEEISNGVLGWPDIFRALNSLLPYSWNWNFLLEIGIIVLGTVLMHLFIFHLKSVNNEIKSTR